MTLPDEIRLDASGQFVIVEANIQLARSAVVESHQ